MRRLLSICAVLATLLTAVCLAQDGQADPLKIPAIKSFLGGGFGSLHEKAPAETEQFGRLVGVWHVEAEVPSMSGKWTKSAPGIWIWKYTLDGFAVSDLWYQGADRLPSYMANLGRDYLLTANRIYDVANKEWKVAWMANGAGKVMGADFGAFTAELKDGQLVMSSPPGGNFGLQRVVFSEISENSFRWQSEYSRDEGKTWLAVMRMVATR